VDYAEARAAFFQPRSGDVTPAADPTPARALRDALEPIATICFWSEPAYDAYAKLGLDFLQGYVWGRGSALGNADGAVAAAAFAVFEPGLVAGLHDAGRAACGLDEIRAAKAQGSAAALEHVLGTPDGLDGVLATLRRGLDAADPTGRPLFAGLRLTPWPGSPLGDLWHAATQLRELRGDGHVAAFVAAGLTGLEANLLTELRVGWEPQSYAGTRGWSPEAMAAATGALAARGLVASGGLTPEGTRLRQEIEDTTDRLVAPVVAAIGSDLDGLVITLDGWARRIVDAGWFPPDPYKRASG
jgi:hypothetical protein